MTFQVSLLNITNTEIFCSFPSWAAIYRYAQAYFPTHHTDNTNNNQDVQRDVNYVKNKRSLAEKQQWMSIKEPGYFVYFSQLNLQFCRDGWEEQAVSHPPGLSFPHKRSGERLLTHGDTASPCLQSSISDKKFRSSACLQ